ncbi:cytochrome b-c1 complex subunit 1, mitochondrial-like [Galleria mellonella]|uniref:Cytochrome b-c1 complex subunit 1, mitochondrial-like n=1 Tax=Galleria mellonella TaxID=7137 RepID=A0ABM3MJP2_GALME|nr:cytochrome b-c1 complex subunit 1, mitochondrial-like [Galleria mellonella]
MLRSVNLLRKTCNSHYVSIRNNPYPVLFQNYLRNLPSTLVTRLPNGLTVATEERDSYNACLGLYFDAGSRYENLFENGITHFFEHIAFKSTRCRSKTVLEDLMSNTAARFRCSTSREMVAYYAECLCQDIPVVVDILSDCIFNNRYAPADLEVQKKIVYCEMMEHDKDPHKLLDDYLHNTAFQGTQLAQTVMGLSSNLYSFNECTIRRYLTRQFDPTRTVFAAVGGLRHDQMVELANQYLCNFEPTKCLNSSEYRYTGSEIRFRDDSLPVANVAIAVEGPSFCHPDKLVMDIAATIVGGWDRSQPGGVDHSMNVARAASITNSCDSYKALNINYKDTGLWGVKFMAPSSRLEDMLYIIQDEWMKLCTMVSDGEVERGRRQLKAKILSKTESCKGACHDIGRWILYNGERPTMLDRMCSIDSIYSKDVKEVCLKYLYDKCPAVAAVGPTEGLPDYTRIRAGMYWMRF